ncbi:MAG TPA: YbjQ family protein [Planctomycetota bacterium]|nr:YbjQ family protein [Planctomycetota bacterium]
MILVTTDELPGREVAAVIGLVRGNTVRARHLGRDILAGLKNMVGGEIDDYTKLLAESREQSLDRMIAEAQARGADAILGLRFATSEIASGASEFLAYGTAVKLVPLK